MSFFLRQHPPFICLATRLSAANRCLSAAGACLSAPRPVLSAARRHLSAPSVHLSAPVSRTAYFSTSPTHAALHTNQPSRHFRFQIIKATPNCWSRGHGFKKICFIAKIAQISFCRTALNFAIPNKPPRKPSPSWPSPARGNRIFRDDAETDF